MESSKQQSRIKRLGGISHSELTDKLVGERGTNKREAYEKKLRKDLKSLKEKNESNQVTCIVLFEKSPTGWGASVPDLPGCIAVANSKSKTRKLIKEAIGFHLKGLKEMGITIPKTRTDAELITIKDHGN
jgi:predicted RNase H-like HicB family nuclease